MFQPLILSLPASVSYPESRTRSDLETRYSPWSFGPLQITSLDSLSGAARNPHTPEYAVDTPQVLYPAHFGGIPMDNLSNFDSVEYYAPTPSVHIKHTSQSMHRAGSLPTRFVSPATPERHSGSIALGTPVLNAHQGISQVELESRSARYRQRNPDVHDFDAKWISSFFGKLASDGTALANFRCYISGCKQVNERQDHMVVHLWSHLKHRPFKCNTCSSTFTRKHELQRHEKGHFSQTRPFVCQKCPNSYRRRDLLLRHVRSKHEGEMEVQEQNVKTARKSKSKT
ncbi:hypothetical protein C8F01DRAFT_1364453 [Mycena amicta]|nr:hypothetical protein C8F01DRAFT_1364453 [Mycena amicta]